MGRAIAYAVLAVAATTSGKARGEQYTRPFGFFLVQTTVADVQKVWGRAVVRETGHSEQTVCYAWPDAGTLVWFMSDREGISGGVTLRAAVGPLPEGCNPIPKKLVASLTPEVGGLRLGMRRREFAEALGGRLVQFPDGQEGTTFEWSEPVDRTKESSVIGDTWYTVVSVSGRFADDRVVELRVRRTVST